MVDMLLFWLVYGAWMVFTWTTIAGVLVTGVSKVVEWITDHDYNLERYVDRFKHVVEYNVASFLVFIVGAIVTFCHGFVYAIRTLSGNNGNLYSLHEFAVIVAEWTSTTMQTPLLIVLTLTGVVVLLKKGYPLFKKIKTLTDTLK